MAVQTLKLNQIRLDGGTQSRVQLNWIVVDEYANEMAAGAQFPPVVVFYDGSEYWLADGFHRVDAARRLGLVDIDADIKQGARRDAVLYSVGANGQHGLRRTNDDKRRAVEMLLMDDEWSQWSNREIARRCAVDEGTVRRLKESICGSSADSQRIATRNGTAYTMNTANIGNGRQPAEAPAPPFNYPTAEEILDCADAAAERGDGLTDEDWADMPDEYLGECIKQCYGPRVMVKGSTLEFGVRGVYVCTGCGYAYPPLCAPVETSFEEWEGDEDEDEDEEIRSTMAVHYSSARNDWLTPPHIIDLVLSVLEKIDVDPCSNSIAAPAIPAELHYTEDDDGLSQPWPGRVYMNPPYGDEIGDWTKHLLDAYECGEVTEAIALVPARTDTRWFRPLLHDYPCCFIHGRLKFGGLDGSDSSAPFPSAAVYMGDNITEFVRVFSKVGTVIRRVTP